MIGNEQTLNHIIEKLDKKLRVCFSRYGDGDFIAMYPDVVNTVIGHHNKSLITPDVKQKLIDSFLFEAEGYYIGTVENLHHPRSTSNNVNFDIFEKLHQLQKRPKKYSAIAFQECFFDNQSILLDFFKIVNKQKTLYVNHYNSTVLHKFLGNITHYIEVPKYNACGSYPYILKQILDIDLNEYDQIFLSCGQLSRVIVKDLFTQIPKKNIFDIGSLSDMLVANDAAFERVDKRMHITDNISKIQNTIKYFDKLLA